MIRIKKGDTVKILSGNNRGKTGEVLTVLTKNSKLIVKNINVVKKHLKASKSNPHGGIADKTLPIDASNVMLVCPKCSKPTRVRCISKDGSKVKTCTKCKGSI